MRPVRKIFVSYRREDAAHPAGRIRDWFVQNWQIPREHVFMDVANILPGADFVQEISRAIAQCDAMIIVISPSWLVDVNQPGVSYPRLEAEAALNQAGLKVIPVLVGGAPLPTEAQLPPSLHPLLKLNLRAVRADSFDYDLGFVAKALGLRARGRSLIGAGLAVLLVAAGVGTLSQLPEGNPVWSIFHAAASPPTTCSSLLGPTSSPAAAVSPFPDVPFPEGSFALPLQQATGSNVTYTVTTTKLCTPGFNQDGVQSYFSDHLGPTGWRAGYGLVPHDGYLGGNCADVALACWFTDAPAKILSLAEPVAEGGLLTYEIGFYAPPIPPRDESQCWPETAAEFTDLSLPVVGTRDQVPLPWYTRTGRAPIILEVPSASDPSYRLYAFCGPGDTAALQEFLNIQLLSDGWTAGTYTLPGTTAKCRHGNSVTGWISPGATFGVGIESTTDLSPSGVKWLLQVCGAMFAPSGTPIPRSSPPPVIG